jgi:hypothetical protein
MARDTTLLTRRYRVDVNTGTFGAPTWTQLLGIVEMTIPKIKATIEKSGDMDDGGAEGNQKTGYGWSMECSVRRKISAGGAKDPAQESLRTKSFLLGADNLAEIRVWERDAGVTGEAFQGTGCVEWEDDKGKPTDMATAKISITGDGQLSLITCPV